jgi:hypothetical protein
MRQQIADLITRYSVFVDDRRLSDVVQLFVSDGRVLVTGKVVTNGRIEMNGHAEISAWLSRLTAGGGPTGKHFLSNMLIEVDEAVAKATTDMMFVKAGTDGRRWDIWELAKYHDEFVLTSAGWRFRSRQIAIFP